MNCVLLIQIYGEQVKIFDFLRWMRWMESDSDLIIMDERVEKQCDLNPSVYYINHLFSTFATHSCPSAQISIIPDSVEYYRGWSITLFFIFFLPRSSRVWVFVCVDDVLPQTQGPQRFRAKPLHHHAICDLTPASGEKLPTDYITEALIAVVPVAKLAELQLRKKKNLSASND